VLAGVELLADGAAGVPGVGDVLVVDVGGATTDVYSVVTPEGEDAVLHRDVVETLWRSRTVEGDLGMRWNAVGVLDAAIADRLVDAAEAHELHPGGAAARRRPGVRRRQLRGARARHPPGRAGRHRRGAPPRAPPASGTIAKDLRAGPGGRRVRRRAPARRRQRARAGAAPVVTDHGGGWKVPEPPSSASTRRTSSRRRVCSRWNPRPARPRVLACSPRTSHRSTRPAP
jgi:hypothetical protein